MVARSVRQFAFEAASSVGPLFFRSVALVRAARQLRRSLHGVKHNASRGIFYIRLEDDDTAVLSYRADGKVMDMRSINVPSHHQGRGLARLLAEAALTYAIVNDYYMLLSCEYMQRFYLATKSPELEERVLGPRHILEASDTANSPESVDSSADPKDFVGSPTAK